MRYLRILLLHSQRVFEQRMRSFVWFLMTFLNPIILIFFWRGALQTSGGTIESWNEADFNTYYLMLMLASNLLTIHIEEHISLYDIRLGNLVSHLVRPFSYYWMMFFYEIPYRILQGTYGIVAAIILGIFFQKMTFLVLNFESALLVLTIITLALFISFTFKMIIGLTAFWITEVDGIQDGLFILGLVFGGYIIPLDFFPIILKDFIATTPFPWITYYPVLALLGKVSNPDMIMIIFQQASWLGGLYVVYVFMWRNGVKKFTAVGQ